MIEKHYIDVFIKTNDYLITLIPLEYLISYSTIIFLLSLLGIIFNKQKNIIAFMLFVELMLFSLSFLVIIFSLIWNAPQGQIFALFIMCIAVAESSIGLGLLIMLYRLKQRIEFSAISNLKG